MRVEFYLIIPPLLPTCKPIRMAKASLRNKVLVIDREIFIALPLLQIMGSFRDDRKLGPKNRALK